MVSEDKHDNDNEEAPASNEGDELLRQALSEIEPLPDPVEEIERDRDQFKALAQRAQADLVNYRRRVDDERQELQRNANASLLTKFLGVVDDFERAIDMLPGDAASAGWEEGLLLVKRNLESLLESEGVSKIDTAGKPFDPWEHEAVHYVESTDNEDGAIVQVFRDGYRLHDRVLRASQVIVAKAPDIEPPDSETQHNQ